MAVLLLFLGRTFPAMHVARSPWAVVVGYPYPHVAGAKHLVPPSTSAWHGRHGFAVHRTAPSRSVNMHDQGALQHRPPVGGLGSCSFIVTVAVATLQCRHVGSTNALWKSYTLRRHRVLDLKHELSAVAFTSPQGSLMFGFKPTFL